MIKAHEIIKGVTCNFCREEAVKSMTIRTSENTRTKIKFCDTHLKDLKREFINEILVGTMED